MQRIEKLVKGLLPAFIPILLFSIAAVAILMLDKVGFFDKGEETITSSSTLVKVLDVSELSTAQFVYNGIAEVMDENDSSKVKYYIYYHATVKAQIDTNDITLDYDEENKTITPLLPKFSVKASLDDSTELQYMPDDIKHDDLTLQEARDICVQDALDEAGKSDELIKIAEDNLKNAIEALLQPIVKGKGYTIKWEQEA